MSYHGSVLQLSELFEVNFDVFCSKLSSLFVECALNFQLRPDPYILDIELDIRTQVFKVHRETVVTGNSIILNVESGRRRDGSHITMNLDVSCFRSSAGLL